MLVQKYVPNEEGNQRLLSGATRIQSILVRASLQDRRQQVRVPNQISHWMLVHGRVPQGTQA